MQLSVLAPLTDCHGEKAPSASLLVRSSASTGTRGWLGVISNYWAREQGENNYHQTNISQYIYLPEGNLISPTYFSVQCSYYILNIQYLIFNILYINSYNDNNMIVRYNTVIKSGLTSGVSSLHFLLIFSILRSHLLVHLCMYLYNIWWRWYFCKQIFFIFSPGRSRSPAEPQYRPISARQ